jgi:tetratricopeptide (TPR) repeat protein
VFGGNPRVGIEMMRRVLERGAREKDDLFNIYSGIGLAYGKIKNREAALKWLEMALELYPNNEYVNEEYRKILD